jgi:hypothetical protein
MTLFAILMVRAGSDFGLERKKGRLNMIRAPLAVRLVGKILFRRRPPEKFSSFRHPGRTLFL